jgi:hypothetical protein
LQCTYYSLTYRLFSIGHITRTIGAISWQISVWLGLPILVLL